MKRFFSMAGLLILCAVTFCLAGEKTPDCVHDLAKNELALLGSDPVLVHAVKQENAKGKTLDEIKAMDAKWKATPGIADFMKALMESESAKHLLKMMADEPYFDEIFLMDNQGAIVALTSKTSDYWQGDEAKFQESFNGGKGAVHIGDVEFDESTQSYCAQVSLPIKDGDMVIGAITFGIDVDKLEHEGHTH